MPAFLVPGSQSRDHGALNVEVSLPVWAWTPTLQMVWRPAVLYGAIPH
jgi:hypothetical protein